MVFRGNNQESGAKKPFLGECATGSGPRGAYYCRRDASPHGRFSGSDIPARVSPPLAPPPLRSNGPRVPFVV